MSNRALKGSELPGSCEIFFEGVHGLKLIRGSKNVAIGGFCIGGYDENRHHIFRSQHNFSARSAGSLSVRPGSRPPYCGPGPNKNQMFFGAPLGPHRGLNFLGPVKVSLKGCMG